MNNMTNCKACNERIQKGELKCTHCGGDQRSFSVKNKVITYLVTAIVLFGSLGMSIATKR